MSLQNNNIPLSHCGLRVNFPAFIISVNDGIKYVDNNIVIINSNNSLKVL